MVLAAAALVVAVAAFAALRVPAVQDVLLGRLLTAMMSPPPEAPDGLRAVVCGSASPLGNDPARAQACIAILTPKHFFLFDVGARSPLRIAQARLPAGRLGGVFLTHFHSDHIAGIPDVNLASWVRGRRQSLAVYGPPGVDRVVRGFNEAYALDRGYRVAHHGEALLPPAAGPMTAHVITPGEIAWQDDELTVRSFIVNHDPIRPAVGYRVDYRGRSVVISGDTVVTDSLFEAAQGADVLFHDALSRALLDPMIAAATKRNLPAMPKIMRDVIEYHADSTRIEARAHTAGVRQLVYYHLVPAPANALARDIFARGLSPDTVLAEDLMIIDLPANSDAIVIHEP